MVMEAFTAIVRPLLDRLQALETNERAEVAGAVESFTVATLPANTVGGPRPVAFASDGRKTAEGVGAGTGVLVYDDGVAWRRVDDGTTVAA